MHFDILAPLYDLLIRPPDVSTLIAAARLPASGRLLDAGGGTGRITQQLDHLIDQVVVVDSSLKMLQQARDKAGLSVTWARAERMPFPTFSFTRIIAVDAYHHFAHQQASLVELWRLLSPGGWLVIEEPDIRNFNVKLIALGEKLTLFRSHFVHAEHIAAQLESLGADPEIQRGDFNYWVSAYKPSS